MQSYYLPLRDRRLCRTGACRRGLFRPPRYDHLKHLLLGSLGDHPFSDALIALQHHEPVAERTAPAAQSARSLGSRAETWKDEPDPEARLVVFQHHAPAMELHDAGDEAQAQTIAGLGAAFIETHEAL